MSITHERLDAFAKAIIGRSFQQLAKGTLLSFGDDRSFAHGRTVGTQLADDLDRVAIGAVLHDFEAPGIAIGLAQSADDLG